MSHAASIQSEQIAARNGTSVGSTGSMFLDAFVLRLSDAKKEMAQWISYLALRNLPMSLVDCPRPHTPTGETTSGVIKVDSKTRAFVGDYCVRRHLASPAR